MARLFAHCPEVVTAAADLGEQCAFGLALIAPQLPPFDVPDGHTEDSWLRHLVMEGARNRYGPPERAPRAYAQIEHELKIIEQLTFPGYFLVVHDITRFCRENNILAQGRGSAANSAVCYALGVTNVDPIANELLFERFLSPARDGPPGHRHRHRIGPAGEGDSVRLRPLRPRLRRPGRQRHHLPRPQRGARHGPRAGVLPGPAGRVEQADRPVGEPVRIDSRRGRSRAGDRPGHADLQPAAAHGHPLRRHGDLRPPHRRRVPGGVGADGEPQRAAVGQR